MKYITNEINNNTIKNNPKTYNINIVSNEIYNGTSQDIYTYLQNLHDNIHKNHKIDNNNNNLIIMTYPTTFMENNNNTSLLKNTTNYLYQYHLEISNILKLNLYKIASSMSQIIQQHLILYKKSTLYALYDIIIGFIISPNINNDYNNNTINHKTMILFLPENGLYDGIIHLRDQLVHALIVSSIETKNIL